MKFSLRKYVAIISLLIVLVMTVLDGTLVNVALPVIGVELGISDSDAVWITTVYQLVITMLLLPVSSAGDLQSYRRWFLAGVIIFTVSSGVCAASESFAMILAARGLQGVGAACVMGVNIALTRLIYPKEILGRGLALNAMVIAVATAAGPTLAGAILSVASWHWLFIINIPLGVVAWFVGRKFLPENPPKGHSVKFDWRSAVENVVSFGLIFYALGTFAGKSGMNGPISILLLGIGMVVGIMYIRRQLHLEVPMLPVDLLRIKVFTLSISTSVSSFIAQNLVIISLPFLFLRRCGFSEFTTGLLMTPWPIATMIVSPVAARFVERHDPGYTASSGMLVFAVGIVALLFIPEDTSVWDVAWRMILCGVGYGLFQTPNNIVMVTATPVERTGGAGGMQGTARLVGQTLGATLVTLVFAVVVATRQAVDICLYAALGFALVAGIFSVRRVVKKSM